MNSEENKTFDLGSLGAFDFTPDWAKKDAGVTVGKTTPQREAGDRGSFGDRPKGPAGDRNRKDGGGVRKPFGDRRPSDDRRPAGDRRGPRGPFVPRAYECPRPLDVDVKILPETKALGTIIRRLQQEAHAYKLKDLAYFFLDNPQSVLLRISPKRDANGAPVGEVPVFHQCKACGFVSTDEADVIAHVLTAHLADYYDSKEIEVEAPKGNFNCVAKCGLSGVLLGPPNIHEFNATVREMIRTRYPDMSEADYRARIEIVRDAEAIEAWRQGAVKRTVFTAKGAGEDARTMTREQAEGEFRRLILPSLLDVPKHLMVTADVALKSPVKPLVLAVQFALDAEQRAPYKMIFALRGAFHNRKMRFFRANDAHGPEFVCSHELKEFDAAHAIPELASVAAFVAEHPCSPKADIAPDAETEKHLNWLVSTGHLVAFTNGVYSAVEKYPKYGPQWQKRAAKKPVAKTDAAVQEKADSAGAVSAEAPAVEEKVAPEEKNETCEASAVTEPAHEEEA